MFKHSNVFIDDAYSLSMDINSKNGFGDEAITTLIQAMDEYKEDLTIILAGYKKEMTEFLESNQGIKSRIGYTFDFKDYSIDELVEIFKLNCEKYKLTYDNEFIDNLKNVIQYYRTKENFGNGRFINVLLQNCLTKHANNYKNDDDLLVLSSEDIPTIQELKSIVIDNTKRIGF